MAYVFRTPNGVASAGNASGGNLTITKPSGIADNDLLIVTLYLESDTNTWTPPTGWKTASNLHQVNTGLFVVDVYWKIAKNEPANWTWAPASNNWRTGVLSSYTGAQGLGLNRVDVAGGSQADGALETGQTAPSVTTLIDQDLVIFSYGNFGGADPSSLVGFATNLRVTLGGVCIGDAIKTPVGATGTTRPTGTGSQDYAAMHVAFKLDAPLRNRIRDPQAVRRASLW